MARRSIFEGRRCTPPAGHRIADCRVARHGTPDLSRAAYYALRDQEVTISVRIASLAPNPAAAGARDWPLLDSLGQPMVRLGTPVAKADAFASCDPSSDGTLVWRYWSIRTGHPARPRLYGWIPGRCPADLRGGRPS